jgi:hypothetical protein
MGMPLYENHLRWQEKAMKSTDIIAALKGRK